MTARWAFLAAGAVSVFTGERLPTPGAAVADDWVGAGRSLRPLARDELVHWLDEELWAVELEPGDDRVRLGRRLERWDADAADDLARACAWRAREQAVSVLARDGSSALAEQLARVPDLAGVEAWAAGTPVDSLPAHAALAADAAALAAGRRPDSWRRPEPIAGSRQPRAVIAANVAFVVAHGAGLEHAATAPDGYAVGVTAERRWQTDWLAQRLDLDEESGLGAGQPPT